MFCMFHPYQTYPYTHLVLVCVTVVFIGVWVLEEVSALGFWFCFVIRALRVSLQLRFPTFAILITDSLTPCLTD